MRQFAFVIHPLDLGLVSTAFNEPNLLKKRPSIIRKAFEWVPSFKCSEVTGVETPAGIRPKGHLIYMPLLPEQIIGLDKGFVLKRALEAAECAKRLGADILGLGAYAAQVGKKGVMVARESGMPVTTGTHYTIYVAVKAVEEAARLSGRNLAEGRFVVVGATGKIGQICAEYFAPHAGELVLSARNRQKLEALQEALGPTARGKIRLVEDAREALLSADFGIVSTTTPDPILDLSELRAGSIVCDVSRPRNISNRLGGLRKDALLIDGGLVKAPGKNVDFNFYFGLPKGMAYACMAETMILAISERYESYSIGGDVTIEKVREVGALGDRHGFNLSSIMSFNQEVHPEDMAAEFYHPCP